METQVVRGFRCIVCGNHFPWEVLELLHELNHCSKCKSIVLTTIKKQKDAISSATKMKNWNNTHTEVDDCFVKEEEYPSKFPKVQKKRGKKDQR